MENSLLFDNLPLTSSPLRIGDIRLELFTVETIDPFIEALEEKASTGLAAFPYWVKIWEAAIALAAHLSEQKPDTDRTVIELGAGTGVVGLFLAASGHNVTLTDFNDNALKLIKKNIDYNDIGSASVQKLDWHRFDPPGRYDIVCGAELVYRQQDIRPALEAVSSVVKPDGTVYLAHDIKRLSMVEFLAEAGRDFEIGHVGKSLDMGSGKKEIIIHTMKPTAG